MSEFRKVTFKGNKLWLDNSYYGEGDSALALEHHVVDGMLDLSVCFKEPSFAHIYDTDIIQYGTRIGSFSDIKEGWEENV